MLFCCGVCHNPKRKTFCQGKVKGSHALTLASDAQSRRPKYASVPYTLEHLLLLDTQLTMSDTLVLFDLDGTLIDSAPDLCAAANRLRTRRGLPTLSFKGLREYCGSGARGMVWQALRIAPGCAPYEAVRKEFLDDYGQHMHDNCRVFDHIREMLSALTQNNIAWGIVTNKSAVFARPICEEMGLLPQACCLVSGSDMGKMKPLPDPIWEGIKLSGGEFKTVTYVGDDYRDALAAKAAGTHFIAAGWGYTKASVAINNWGADAIALSPSQLPGIVREFFC